MKPIDPNIISVFILGYFVVGLVLNGFICAANDWNGDHQPSGLIFIGRWMAWPLFLLIWILKGIFKAIMWEIG